MTEKAVQVTATTDHPDSSYGKAVWVDDNNQAYCQVGMEQPLYSVIVEQPTEDGKQEFRQRIGDMLRSARLLRGWSQRDLAENASVTQPQVAALENGSYSAGIDILGRICNALGIGIKLE